MATDRTVKLNELQEKVDLIFRDIDRQGLMAKIASLTPKAILETIIRSGLRGRGGAGFPTGLKWKGAAEAAGKTKYVLCNADEGEPGTFKDRRILGEQADKVLLGMAACGRAVGAVKGLIYMRGEYAFLRKALQDGCRSWNRAFERAGLNFDVELRMGSGAYVCGEETALIESLEGQRGEPRNKPPFPASVGYLNAPTVINNVETLAYAAMIIQDGPDRFRSLGTKDSLGGKVFSISGDASVKGIYELPLGMTLAEFVDLFGDGDTKAVQVGGSSGTCVPRKLFAGTIIGFEGIPTGGSMMLFNSSRSMYHVLENYLEFFAEESCGQCSPCRVGCQQLLRGLRAVHSGAKPDAYLDKLRDLAGIMSITSKCGLGQSLVNPFNSITEHFREEISY